MNLAQNIITNIKLNEAQLPNKYKDIVEDFYKGADGYWVAELKDGLTDGYGHIYIWEKTIKEIIEVLERIYNDQRELNEDAFDNWKYQIDLKFQDELEDYLNKLYNKLNNYNKNNLELKSNEFYDLLNKINYIENKLGIKPKIGRELK